MEKHWKYFFAGAASMLIIVMGAYYFFIELEQSSSYYNLKSINKTMTVIPPETVTVKTLPAMRIISGTEVSFEGRTELKQVLSGRLAKNIVIVKFQAVGEHAEKSVIRIVWENGEVEQVSPGTVERRFLAEKRAAEITVCGYSMHERRIFQDSPRKGALTWEIRYEPVEL